MFRRPLIPSEGLLLLRVWKRHPQRSRTSPTIPLPLFLSACGCAMSLSACALTLMHVAPFMTIFAAR
jgi:hypothetical protein